MAAKENDLPDDFELRPATRIQLEPISNPRNGQTLSGHLTFVNRGPATVFYRLKVARYTEGVSAVGARGQVAPRTERPVTLLLTPEAAEKAQLRLKLNVQGANYAVRLTMAHPTSSSNVNPTVSSSASLGLETTAVEADNASAHLRDNIEACVRNAVADVFMRMATLARGQTGPTSVVETPDEGHVSDVIMDRVTKHLRRMHLRVTSSKSSVDDVKQVRSDSQLDASLRS
uniref:Uncharacterized protein n=1 Tax=Plectus sambesii TaxID=2011161 RepID=A0A914WMM6_9BILA